MLSIADAGTDWAAVLPAGAAPASEEPLLSALDVAWLVAFALVGGFVASHLAAQPDRLGAVRRPRRADARSSSASRVYFHAARAQGHDPGVGAELALWVANSLWVPAVLLVLVALPLLFPTGRPPTPRWRIVGWAAVAGGVLLFAGTAFLAGPLENYHWVDNPVGVGVDAGLRQLGRVRACGGRRRSPPPSRSSCASAARTGPSASSSSGSPPPRRCSSLAFVLSFGALRR